MSTTCNRLDLQTLGSQPIMPKTLPGHWSRARLPISVYVLTKFLQVFDI
jgi:hypothetical protein